MAEKYLTRNPNDSLFRMHSLLAHQNPAATPISRWYGRPIEKAPDEPPKENPAPKITFVVELTGTSSLEEALPLLSGALGESVRVTHAVQVAPERLPGDIQEQLLVPEPVPEERNGTRELLERFEEEGLPMGKAYQYLKEHGGTASATDVEEFVGVSVNSLVLPGVINKTDNGDLFCPHVDDSGTIFTNDKHVELAAAD